MNSFEQARWTPTSRELTDRQTLPSRKLRMQVVICFRNNWYIYLQQKLISYFVIC